MLDFYVSEHFSCILHYSVFATDNRKYIGSMCYMSGSIQMENVYVPENEVGMWQWLFGKAVTSIVLLNQGSSDGFVGIAAPSLARILPVCTYSNIPYFSKECLASNGASLLLHNLSMFFFSHFEFTYFL